MKLKDLYEKILFYVCVPTCVCCGEKLDIDERALCKNCLNIYNEEKTRTCSRCNKTLQFCSCSNKYLESHFVKSLTKSVRYRREAQNSPTNMLIYSLKQDNRRDVLSFIANEIAISILNCNIIDDKSNFIITNVPRRKRSVRYYGFDHTEQLCKILSKTLGIEYRKLFISKSKKAQKETVGAERINNAVFDYRYKTYNNIKGKKLIIVDDIVTTGSSIGKCASLAKGIGVKKVYGSVLSIAYKDRTTTF